MSYRDDYGEEHSNSRYRRDSSSGNSRRSSSSEEKEELVFDRETGNLVVREDPCGLPENAVAAPVRQRPVVTRMQATGYF